MATGINALAVSISPSFESLDLLASSLWMGCSSWRMESATRADCQRRSVYMLACVSSNDELRYFKDTGCFVRSTVKVDNDCIGGFVNATPVCLRLMNDGAASRSGDADTDRINAMGQTTERIFDLSMIAPVWYDKGVYVLRWLLNYENGFRTKHWWCRLVWFLDVFCVCFCFGMKSEPRAQIQSSLGCSLALSCKKC